MIRLYPNLLTKEELSKDELLVLCYLYGVYLYNGGWDMPCTRNEDGSLAINLSLLVNRLTEVEEYDTTQEKIVTIVLSLRTKGYLGFSTYANDTRCKITVNEDKVHSSNKPTNDQYTTIR